jgi:hypothetical protein
MGWAQHHSRRLQLAYSPGEHRGPPVEGPAPRGALLLGRALPAAAASADLGAAINRSGLAAGHTGGTVAVFHAHRNGAQMESGLFAELERRHGAFRTTLASRPV